MCSINLRFTYLLTYLVAFSALTLLVGRPVKKLGMVEVGTG